MSPGKPAWLFHSTNPSRPPPLAEAKHGIFFLFFFLGTATFLQQFVIIPPVRPSQMLLPHADAHFLLLALRYVSHAVVAEEEVRRE